MADGRDNIDLVAVRHPDTGRDDAVGVTGKVATERVLNHGRTLATIPSACHR